MRKLFLRCSISAVVLLLGTNLALARKITIELPENPNIETVTIDNDNLTIKTKDQQFHFKLSEIIKNSSKTVKKTAPQNVTEAFALNGKWYFFDNKNNRLNRLQYAFQKKYKVFKEGELLQKVTYKNKSYARDLKGNIFIPHWEINNNFDTHLVPAATYISQVQKTLESYKKKISKISIRIPNLKKSIKEDREQYIKLLKSNNLSTTMIDKNGNIVTTHNSSQYNSKLTRELRIYHKNIKKQEQELTLYEKRFKLMRSNIYKLKKNLIIYMKLYQQYCQK